MTDGRRSYTAITAASLGLWLGLATIVSGCATSASGNDWYAVRSPRFLLWTDIEPESAREIARDLERYHEVLLATTTAKARDAVPPLRIFLARNSGSFADLLGSDGGAGLMPSGLFLATDRGNFALADASDWSATVDYAMSGRARLFHEYAHAVLAMNGSVVPSWYNEGFAEYMSTTTFDEDGSFTIGCPPIYRTAYRGVVKWVPMQQILEADNITALMKIETGFARTRRAAVESYLQSWYMFHYFASDSVRERQLQEYLRLWAAGTAVPVAFERAFGSTIGEVEAAIERYSQQSTVGCVVLKPKTKPQSFEIAVRPLGRGEALYHIADLMLVTQGPSEKVLAVLSQAARHTNVPAMRALARVHLMRAQRRAGEQGEPGEQLGEVDREQELAEAARQLDRARGLEPDSAEGASLAGDLERLRAEGLKAADHAGCVAALARARASYRAAIRWDDALPEAYLGLGLTYAIDDNGSEEGVVALEAAAYLLPLSVRPALEVARLHIHRGHKDKALPALRFVLRWAADAETRATARRLLEGGAS